GLEAEPHGSLNPALGFRVAHALGEEIGIATAVLDRRERDRIDPFLDHGMTGGRKLGDAVSERSNEVADCGPRQRSIVRGSYRPFLVHPDRLENDEVFPALVTDFSDIFYSPNFPTGVIL